MPGRVRSRKFSPQKESEFRMRILGILAASEEAMTIDEIKRRDFTLQGLSTQKIARVLGYLIEMGFVRKGKSKSLGRMVYKFVSVMTRQGYNVDSPHGKYGSDNWELEEEMALRYKEE